MPDDIYITRAEYEARSSLMQTEISKIDTKIESVSNKIDRNNITTNTKIDRLTNSMSNARVEGWKYIATFILSSVSTAVIEWIVTHH